MPIKYSTSLDVTLLLSWRALNSAINALSRGIYTLSSLLDNSDYCLFWFLAIASLSNTLFMFSKYFGEHGTPIHSLPKSVCGDILECFKALRLCFTDMPISHSIERRIMSTSNHFVSIIYILIDKSEVIRKTLYSCNFSHTHSSI